MGYSPLAKYVDLSTRKYNKRNRKIEGITVHHYAGVVTLGDASRDIKGKAPTSWNYAISYDGKIGVYVDESNRAWTTADAPNDHRTVTIEVSNSQTGGNWPVSDAAFKALLDLCTDICRRNNIKGLSYTGKKQGSNLMKHCWFKSTLCPGPYLGAKFPEIARTVNSRLGITGNVVVNDSGSSSSGGSSTTYSGPVKIGHATLGESGKFQGGKAGDQTGKEVYIRNWYSKPWTCVLRPNTATLASKMAHAMEQACANDNIGYDNGQRTTLYDVAKLHNFDLSKVNVPCETDCSALISVCINAAGVEVSKDIRTYWEKDALLKTGKFTAFTDKKYTGSSSNLKRGDVLLGNGHTAMVLSNGANVSANYAGGYSDGTSYSYAESGEIIEVDPKTLINVEKITQYLITLDRNTKKVDYKKLQQLGVVGAIIEAGSLFDNAHKEIYYVSPKLKSQTEEAAKARIPIGLYTQVRARSVSEAKKEIAEMRTCVQKYPPSLGLWLNLKLANTKNINNDIIELYYNEAVDLGLKDKVGIYATKTQLKLIDWDKFKTKFSLWIVDHLSDISEADKLLEPEFFDVEVK